MTIFFRKSLLAGGILVLSVLLGACSVEISSTSTVSTPRPPTATATRAPTRTPLPPTDTPEPTATQPGDELTPTATASPTATPVPFDFPPAEGYTVDAQVKDIWQDLGLEGKLTFLAYTGNRQAVLAFDIATGELYPIFAPPENAWVLSASLPPDRSEMVLAYSPAPDSGTTQSGYTDLYLLPAGEDTPVPLLERSVDVESYFTSFYGSAGQYVYYSWFFTDDSVDYGFRYFINRLDPESGIRETVVEDGFWQTVSRDGRYLAYVTLDPNAAADDPAELRVLDLETGEETTVLDPAQFPTVDAPFFSPDASYLYFSAVSETQESLSWLDQLLGVRLASAHNVPSDWWRVNLESGEAERITEILDQGMFGVFAPDGSRIAFISATGLWLINDDGSDLLQLVDSNSFYGNLEWTP